MLFLRDISIALRTLAKRPGFFLVAALTLAIGIGANTAVFSLFEALVLRSLAAERPEELVVLGPGAMGVFSRSDRPQREVFSYTQYRALSRDSNGVFATVAAAPTFDTRVYWGDAVAPGSDLQRASCMLVTGSYFRLLGARPFLGRLIGSDDDGAPGSNPVAVVSHEFWESRLGSSPDAIGSTIRMQGAPYTVIGVAEPSFRGHVADFRIEVWIPMSMQQSVTLSPSRLQREHPIETFWLNIFGRLQPGVSRDQAETAINARLQEVFLKQAGDGISEEHREELARTRIRLHPMERGISRLRSAAAKPLALLWAATGLVLLIACANIGGLLLVRAAGRRHELGIRRALGAATADLMRPLMAESVVIAGAGTAAGCALAYWLVPILRDWLAAVRGAGALQAQIAGPALGSAAAVGALAVFVFGLLPAALAARGAVASRLRDGGTSQTPGRAAVRARNLLVAGQCALAVVLLATAGLFLQTLAQLRAADLGLDADRVIGIGVDPRGGGYQPETQPSMRRRLLERVAALPGIESAAFTGSLPLRGNFGASTISVSGYEPGEGEDMSVLHVWASPRYFETLGIRVIEGRTPEEREGDALAVNRAFAARFFADRSAVGGLIGQTDRIVGVVANVRHVNLRDQPPPIIYRPTADYEGFLGTLAVRSSTRPQAVFESVRDAVREVAPGMPVDRQFRTVELHLERQVALESMLAKLVGAFAAVALLLSAIGLFGLCSYAVRSRTSEIGLRLALGSTTGRVQALVIGHASKLLCAGAVAGIFGAVAAGRAVSGLLYQVEPLDWQAFAWALAALALFAGLAAGIPALRARRVQPAEALRH